MAPELVHDSRGNLCLLYDNYKFGRRRDRCTRQAIFWVCSKKSCTVSLRTTLDLSMVRPIDKQHTHPPMDAAKVARMLAGKVKRSKIDVKLKRILARKQFCTGGRRCSLKRRGDFRSKPVSSLVVMALVHVFECRGRLSLLHQNYKYGKRRNRSSSDEICWVCSKNSCTVSLRTGSDLNDLFMVRASEKQHLHSPLEDAKVEEILMRTANEARCTRRTKLSGSGVDHQASNKPELTEAAAEIASPAATTAEPQPEPIVQTADPPATESANKSEDEEGAEKEEPEVEVPAESVLSRMCSSPRRIMDTPQQYCLRWKYHHSNLQAMFSQLLERECFCDVTLACEGKTIKAHKVMLSACSTYFDSIFSQYEENSNPIVILKDVKFSNIKALVQFMYKGEINVDNSELTSLLKTAEDLRIKGLAEVSWRSDREMEAGEESTVEDDEEEDEEEEERAEPPLKRIKEAPKAPIIPPFVAASHFNNNSILNNRNSRDEYERQSDGELDAGSETENESRADNGWPNSYSENDADESKPSSQHCSALQSAITSRLNSNLSLQQMINSPTIANASSMVSPSQQRSNSPVAATVTDDDKNPAATTPFPNLTTDTATTIDLSQFPDIMKMNEYLESGGRRPQFWEEPFTKRLMEAIKNKELEMKVAAELMGVSYGTLYGRYRDAYGCLKHPYRVRDFWSEQGPAEVLGKLQRKELTLFRAAEMLNVTVTTLANYLSTVRQTGNNTGTVSGALSITGPNATPTTGAGYAENEEEMAEEEELENSDNEEMVIDEDKLHSDSVKKDTNNSCVSKVNGSN